MPVYITDIAAGVLTSHIGSDVRPTITWVLRTGTIIISDPESWGKDMVAVAVCAELVGASGTWLVVSYH